MKRYTERNSAGACRLKDSYGIRHRSIDVGMQDAIDRLAEYEDAEEAGLLVRLPCRVGDTVCCITKCENVHARIDNYWNNGTGAIECPFENDCNAEDCNDDHSRIFETECSGFMIEDGAFHTFLSDLNVDVSDDCWGKTVFLTRPEAETARRKEDAP